MIEARQATFMYVPGKRVLDQTTLISKPGVVTSIAGRNGSGKSTLLSIMVGKRAPAEGVVFVDGKNPVSWRNRSSVAYMPQHSHFPQMTKVKFILSFVSSSYPQPLRGARLGELLEEFDLHRHLEQRCGALSGGWARRLSMVCALLTGADNLVLDEPTAGLDQEGRIILLNRLASHAAMGGTVLLATHAAEDLLSLNSDIHLLRDGKITRLGALWDFALRAKDVSVSVLSETPLAPVAGIQPERRGVISSFRVARDRVDAVVSELTAAGHSPRVEELSPESALKLLLADGAS